MTTEELYSIFSAHPNVTTDSRNCPQGSIFFALKGDTFNGNAYAKAAIDNGCAYAVVDQQEFAIPNDNRFILVDDTLVALQQLANYHRRQLGTRIIGITGTNGKTTTKELISAVLKRKYHTLYTLGNLNNHIGVPLTLLRLTSEHEIAVVEMGANHPGEINTLVNIVEPDLGLITNVGKAHLLGFGSFEGVIRTKGELYDFMRATNKPVFINNDNSHLLNIANGLQLIRYGLDDASALLVKGNLISTSPFLKFAWKYKDSEHTIQTKLIGAYNLDNALAAITVGVYCDVSTDAICTALEEYTPSNNRSQLKQTEHNTLIIDAYNANPTSMSAALQNFRLMESQHKMCILGDMKELGDASNEEHNKVIHLLTECDFECIWLVGHEFRKSFTDLKDSNVRISSLPVHTFTDITEVKDYIATNHPEGYTILIKGSNSTRLIDIVEKL